MAAPCDWAGRVALAAVGCVLGRLLAVILALLSPTTSHLHASAPCVLPWPRPVTLRSVA